MYVYVCVHPYSPLHIKFSFTFTTSWHIHDSQDHFAWMSQVSNAPIISQCKSMQPGLKIFINNKVQFSHQKLKGELL